MSDLSGKIAFITGASAGIGEACARLMAAHGTRLILAARRRARLEELARKLPVDVHVIELDVRNRDDVEHAVRELPPAFAAIDILVNNAGVPRGLDKLHEGNVDGWDEMIDTNIKGLLYVSRAVIPGMVQRGRGHIINIGSIAGHEVYLGGNVYCATKHAVDALSRALRIDLVDTPLRVTCVAPGLVQTEFSEVRFWGDKERAAQVYKGYQPLTGDDVAEAIVWAAEQPAHVQVAEIILLPTAQASAMVVHKRL